MSDADASTKENALVTAPSRETAIAFFSADYDTTIAPLLKQVRAVVDAFMAEPPALTTAEGRAAHSSLAYKIARSKTALDESGKAVVAELKALPAKIDANRKKVRDTLDLWRDEVRAPLDAYEAKEADRIKGHADAITRLNDSAALTTGRDAATLESWLATTAARVYDAETGEEFAEEYQIAQKSAVKALQAALDARRAYEADQAELAALRQAKAERDAKDEAERIEAETKVRADARIAAENRAAEEKIAREAESARLADERAAREKAEAEAARLRKEADDRAAADRKAEADRLAAEAKAKADAAAADARAANARHQASVQVKAADDLAKELITIPGGLRDAGTSEICAHIIVAIVAGKIRGVKIEF